MQRASCALRGAVLAAVVIVLSFAGHLSIAADPPGAAGQSAGGKATQPAQRICGLGIAIDTRDGEIVINRVIPNSPAEEAKLPVGCVIVTIDGHELKGATVQDALARLAGKEGQAIALKLRLGDGTTRDVRLVRRFFDVPPNPPRLVRIDYVLANEAAARRCVGARVMNEPALDQLSDHYPVMADFEFDGKGGRPKKLRVVTYNVLVGFRFEPERKEKIAKWLAEIKPDVVAFQELNGMKPKDLRAWAELWGHKHVCMVNLRGFAVGLTSSAPLANVERLTKGYQHGVVAADTHGVRVFALHLTPGEVKARFAEVQQLAQESDSYSQHDEPRIMLGDFNAISPLDRAFYEEHPWPGYAEQFAPMELLLNLGWRDVVVQHRSAKDRVYSWPTPMSARVPK